MIQELLCDPFLLHAHIHTNTPSSSREMPLLDEDLAVGCVQLESSESGNYSRSYMIIDFSTQKLRLYPEEAEFASDLSQYTVQIKINCQYITKVPMSISLLCTLIGGATKVQHIIKVHSSWSVNQGTT